MQVAWRCDGQAACPHLCWHQLTVGKAEKEQWNGACAPWRLTLRRKQVHP